MARFVMKNGFANVGGVDLSDRVKSFTVNKETPEEDATAMGDDYQVKLRGIPDATMEIEFYQDFAAGEVNATLWPLSDTDTPFPIKIRADAGAISAANPEFQMTALLFNYEPISGEVGTVPTTTVAFRNADPAGIVMDVTP